jgi:hypothetical protein
MRRLTRSGFIRWDRKYYKKVTRRTDLRLSLAMRRLTFSGFLRFR